jgi:putative hydrolase of the HAD superfamily
MESDVTYHGVVAVFDLDDTLYSEADYARSAYQCIGELLYKRYDIDSTVVTKVMSTALALHENPFDALFETVKDVDLQNDFPELLNLYRTHKPNIRLYDDARQLLDLLSRRGVRLGLITDGRKISQRNKIESLGISHFFSHEDIIISEEIGVDKLSFDGYVHFVHRYPEASEFYYIGDNPAKDFRIPNILGWTTICLLDNGHNVHPQNFGLDNSDEPKVKINRLSQLADIIIQKRL